MRAEHLCQWLVSATRYDTFDATKWNKLVALVKIALHDGALAKECTWQTIVLIPKGKSGNFRRVRTGGGDLEYYVQPPEPPTRGSNHVP